MMELKNFLHVGQAVDIENAAGDANLAYKIWLDRLPEGAAIEAQTVTNTPFQVGGQTMWSCTILAVART